jgi:hypothetical protein
LDPRVDAPSDPRDWPDVDWLALAPDWVLEPWACTRGIWGIANATSAAVATDKANSLITSSEGLAPRPSIPAVAELFRREFTFLFYEQTFIFWLLAREIKHPAAAAAGCPRACQFRGLCEVRNPLHRGISRSDECEKGEQGTAPQPGFRHKARGPAIRAW